MAARLEPEPDPRVRRNQDAESEGTGPEGIALGPVGRHLDVRTAERCGEVRQYRIAFELVGAADLQNLCVNIEPRVAAGRGRL